MFKKIRTGYRNMPLASKIRYSYAVILIPSIMFVISCFVLMQQTNRRYDQMINAAIVASEFSLDFKKDFDYETYLLIVENKTISESSLNDLLNAAGRVVNDLEEITTKEQNDSRLKSTKKYLYNLSVYKSRIEDNLIAGNRYEENIEIWENDVQIVTALLRESMLQYIYYEIQDMQTTRSDYQVYYVRVITASLIVLGVLGIIIVIMSYIIPATITKPIKTLSEVTDQVAKGDLTVRADVEAGAEVKVLSDSLNAMIDKISELLDQVTTEQIRLRKAELELLQAQINPHFLYNTLDTIVWLAEAGKQAEVVSMVGSLSAFFRTSLNQGKDIISLEEELLHVRSYLAIQKVRYQDILEYEINVPAELNSCEIPKITLQPLVENALYHGIKNKRGLGKITISGEVFEDHIEIVVADNGIGMTPERLTQVKESLMSKSIDASKIYGVFNVNERIKLKFGEESGLSFDSEHGIGTRVTITLPPL